MATASTVEPASSEPQSQHVGSSSIGMRLPAALVSLIVHLVVLLALATLTAGRVRFGGGSWGDVEMVVEATSESPAGSEFYADIGVAEAGGPSGATNNTSG